MSRTHVEYSKGAVLAYAGFLLKIEEASLAGVYKSGRWNKNSEASSPLRLVKAGLNETRMQISKSRGGILIQLVYSTPHLHLNLLPAQQHLSGRKIEFEPLPPYAMTTDPHQAM